MPKNLQQASNSIKHQTANNLQPVQSSLSKCLSYTFFHHMFHHVGDSNSFFLPWFFLWKHLFHLLTWEVTPGRSRSWRGPGRSDDGRRPDPAAAPWSCRPCRCRWPPRWCQRLTSVDTSDVNMTVKSDVFDMCLNGLKKKKKRFYIRVYIWC